MLTVPANVQEQLNFQSAIELANRIRKQADDLYDELYADFQCENNPEECTQTYSIRACNTMSDLLPQVKILSEMQGGHKLALDVTLYIGRRTCIGLKRHWVTERSIPLFKRDAFDIPADNFLRGLVVALKQSNFMPEKTLDELTMQRRAFRTDDTYPLQLYQHRDIDAPHFPFPDGYLEKTYRWIWG